MCDACSYLIADQGLCVDALALLCKPVADGTLDIGLTVTLSYCGLSRSDAHGSTDAIVLLIFQQGNITGKASSGKTKKTAK